MNEGPHFNWRWLPRLLTLIGILVSIGVTLAAFESKRGDVAFYLLPFAAGLALGDVVPKRTPLDLKAVLLAPFFAAFAVGVIAVAHGTYEAAVEPNPTVTAPYIVQGLSAAFFIVPGAFVYGAIPSIVGTAISNSLKSPSILGFLISD